MHEHEMKFPRERLSKETRDHRWSLEEILRCCLGWGYSENNTRMQGQVFFFFFQNKLTLLSYYFVLFCFTYHPSDNYHPSLTLEFP